jgi:hypothetical protein
MENENHLAGSCPTEAFKPGGVQRGNTEADEGGELSDIRLIRPGSAFS